MTNIYKKLIVFDFNIDWNKYDSKDKRFKDIDLIYSLLNQAIKKQPVVITTSGCFTDALDFINKVGIKDGYIVASGGAVIYSIDKQKILQNNMMIKEDVKAIIHHGIMLGLNVAFVTLKHKYIYVSDSVTYSHIEKSLYSPFIEIKDYEQLKEILNKEDIVDMAFVSPYKTGKNDIQRSFQYKIERYFENEQSDLIIKTNQSSPFAHFSCKDSTKLKALQKVMAYTNVEHLNDILYIGATCINRQCYLHFKNTLISSNPDFIVEISGAKQPKYISEEINNLSPDFGKETNSFWK